MTDGWLPPGSPVERSLAALGGPSGWFGGRFEPALADANVMAFSEQAVAFEAGGRVRRSSGWDHILRRNAWFQRQARAAVEALMTPGDTVFSYSYTARDLFRLAKARGCRTVLGQIDGARGEEDIVAEEVARHPDVRTGFQRVASRYWDEWLEECALADVVIVNSRWCEGLIVRAGVPPDKIRVIPLAYERGPEAPLCRAAPFAFTPERPLRALFLGQVIPRKGVFPLLEAADLLAARPVEFVFVGETGPLGAELARRTNVRATGAVAHERVAEYFRSADVFILPTLSDGFGQTLLEAAAERLPVICSDRCGEVIEHGVHGIVLNEVNGRAIADALAGVLRNPAQLSAWSDALVSVPPRFSIDRLADRLASGFV